MTTMTEVPVCDRCFQSTLTGEHGVGVCPFEPRRSAPLVVPDEVPGGFWVENGFATPQKFYSKQAHREALAREGHQLAPKWVPGDRHLSRWVSVDLKAATALVSRGAVPATEETGPSGLKLLPKDPPCEVRVTDAGWKVKGSAA
jgi:hypothetical protein